MGEDLYKSFNTNHVCTITDMNELTKIVQKFITPYINHNIQIYFVTERELFQLNDKIKLQIGKIMEIPNVELIDVSMVESLDKRILKMSQVFANKNRNDIFVLVNLINLKSYHKDPIATLMEFELQIEDLISSFPLSTTLCIYPEETLDLEEKGNIIDLHPYCLNSGKLLQNISFHDITLQNEIRTICMICHRYRNKLGQWVEPKGTLLSFEVRDFSHGICQDCKNIHYS